MSFPKLMVPALIAVATGAASAADTSLQVHGFASQGYLRTSDVELYGQETTHGTFSFNDFGVNVTSSPIERVRVGVQIFANSLGDFGRDEVKIDWAYGEYNVPVEGDNRLAVTAGRFKTGHGLYNDYRDLDMTRTSVFLPESVYAAQFRDFFLAVNGGGLSGSVGLGKAGSLDAQAWVGTQSIDNQKGPVAETFTSLGFIRSISKITVDSLQGGSLTWNTPVDGLRWKGSILTAKHLKATMSAKATSFGPFAPSIAEGATVITDLPVYTNIIVGGEYQVGDFTFASEYSNQYWKALTEVPLTVGPGITVPMEQADYSRMHGGYFSGAYRFHPKWEAAASFNMMFETFGNDIPKEDRRNWVALALRYDVTDHFLVKAEFERSRGYLGTRSRDNPNGREEYWNLMAIKTTFDF